MAKWIGLCGELGAKGSVLPLLVGLGLDELSMSAPSIPAAKARMAQLDSRECRQLLNQQWPAVRRWKWNTCWRNSA